MILDHRVGDKNAKPGGRFSIVAVEPPPSEWSFPHPDRADENGIVGTGADLRPGTILAAYRNGIFPMPLQQGALAWWSPDPRGVLPLDALKISRSLRKSCARYEIRVDTAFEEVIVSCGDPHRPHGWITPDILNAYVRLHELGWAHSVETWSEDNKLVGGLYGVNIGGLFAGESMFHRVTDGSKVALVGLVTRLGDNPDTLLDVQWLTPHLESLGAIEIDRGDYLHRLGLALRLPAPTAFSR